MEELKNNSYTPKECFFCKENISKYCCPRCNEQYCSLDCYRSEQHMECSESFYRECVTQEMTGFHVDEGSQIKMKDILQKMHNQDIENNEEVINDEEDIDSDDDEYVDLHQRIDAVNLDDAEAVWNALTQDERNEFEAIVSGGDIGKLVKPWQPWWVYRKESKLVEEVKYCREEEEALKMCPKIKEVPELSSISKTKPSECIKHNITNVIASYAFTARYFNGELDGYEVVAYLLSICGSLGKNTNYEDDVTAIGSVEQGCVNSTIIDTDQNSLQVMKHDVYQILKGPSEENKTYYVRAALSHTHKLMSEAKKCSRKSAKKSNDFTQKFPEQSEDHLPEFDLSKIKHTMKKIEYFLAYVKSYGCSSE